MTLDAKIQAREWILNAIQNHSRIPNKETEREIRKFIERMQRDMRQMERSRQLFIAVNSQDKEERTRAIQNLGEMSIKIRKGRKPNRTEKSKELSISRLIHEQKKDLNDKRIRFKK